MQSQRLVPMQPPAPRKRAARKRVPIPPPPTKRQPATLRQRLQRRAERKRMQTPQPRIRPPALMRKRRLRKRAERVKRRRATPVWLPQPLRLLPRRLASLRWALRPVPRQRAHPHPRPRCQKSRQRGAHWRGFGSGSCFGKNQRQGLGQPRQRDLPQGRPVLWQNQER